MILSFRCPPHIKEKVEVLVAVGLYPDFSSFCVTALENQLLLEETNTETGSYRKVNTEIPEKKGITGARAPNSKTSARPNNAKSESSSALSAASLQTRGESEIQVSQEDTRALPWLQNLVDLDLVRIPQEPPFPLPSSFADIFQDNEPIPVDRWLFGQYNRLLPAKISLRTLALISTEGKDALVLEAVAPRIAEIAAKFGRYLQSLDQRFSSHRDETLATAFPEEGAQGQKGRLRYQNHFVGHTVKGEQGGLLVGLKLAVIQVIKNKPRLFPTTAGWDFARLANPLIDAQANALPARFSEEEISFLLQHIREHVPVERFAYSVMLSIISQGNQTPESVSHALARHLSPERKPEDERDFLATQRTGALGRMSDLNLVSRERNGTRITYQLTPLGRQFLKQVPTIPQVHATSREASNV